MSKLVRDKIVKIIEGKGEKVKFHFASEEEYWEKLKEKLLEEVKEFISEPNEEELADILEVLDSIKKFKGFEEDEIENLKNSKLNERGGFEDKIILDDY